MSFYLLKTPFSPFKTLYLYKKVFFIFLIVNGYLSIIKEL